MKDLNMSAYESTPQSLTLHLNLSSPKRSHQPSEKWRKKSLAIALNHR